MAYIDEIIANIEQNICNVSIKKIDDIRLPLKFLFKILQETLKRRQDLLQEIS